MLLFAMWSDIIIYYLSRCCILLSNQMLLFSIQMQIPTEHFEHIPVYTLSPSPLTPGSENDIFIFDA